MTMQDSRNKPGIPEFFAGKTVALTGATGFIGQLLIEKLLRSCPDIKGLILLIRSKKGKSITERLQKIIEPPIFDKLRKTQPGFASKLIPVSADIEKPGFALSDEDVQLVLDEVNVFIHSAATTKFNEHLTLSYAVNTNGVHELLKLCRKIKNLHAFVHISTAFSFCDKSFIGEEVYPTGWDYDKLRSSIQWMSDDMVSDLTPNIVKDRPNTYTLTKAFGEEVLVKEGEGLPICIIRPSIVGSTYNEPIPGWCRSLNGPTGHFIAFAKGYARLLCARSDHYLDIIPADFVVNGIIAAAWKTALSGRSDQLLSNVISTTEYHASLPKNISREQLQLLELLGYTKEDESVSVQARRKSIPIYHIVTNPKYALTVSRMASSMMHHFTRYPVDNALRLPENVIVISNKFLYRTCAFFLEYIPACMFDAGLILFGQKPKLLRVLRLLSSAMTALQFFLYNHWEWDEGSTLKLQREMSDRDQKEFNFSKDDFDLKLFIERYYMGTKRYVLKEDPLGYPAARRHLWRLRVLGWIFQFCVFMITWRILIPRSQLARNLWHLLTSFWSKFLRFTSISSSLSRFKMFH
ncbi:fatty acyl-CoA reductase 1-like isoform X2 [Clavelina lepadiformis]|uniref:fatty acyl-CoA reductase 1-like isoform X2 n=1 Tax=Clavelina lepadiformis TaxID=159417 RepID=UPI004041E85C